jgi:hypothetical protein
MKLYPTNFLRGRSLHATDGEIGQCTDFLFDDFHYTIRYLVVDTSKWLPGRKVVISPAAVDHQALLNRDGNIRVRLTREQIQDSPSLDEHLPVSMKVEAHLSTYYGWPVYWSGPYPWGLSEAVPAIGINEHALAAEIDAIENDDSRLRSAIEVMNYHIQTLDGELGHVEDFAFGLPDWRIKYMILDTRNWLPGRKLAIPPEWITEIDATTNTARVNHTRQSLTDCPEIDPHSILSDAQVEELEQQFT